MIHAGKWEETLTYLEVTAGGHVTHNDVAEDFTTCLSLSFSVLFLSQPFRTQTDAYGAIEFAVRKQQYLEMLNSKVRSTTTNLQL